MKPNTFLFYAEFYCREVGCPIREVVIRSKYPRGDKPEQHPEMNCPQCGKPLTFHGHLGEEERPDGV